MYIMSIVYDMLFMGASTTLAVSYQNRTKSFSLIFEFYTRSAHWLWWYLSISLEALEGRTKVYHMLELDGVDEFGGKSEP